MVEESLEKLVEDNKRKDQVAKQLKKRIKSLEETLDSRAVFERVTNRAVACCIRGCGRPASKPLAIDFTFHKPTNLENMTLDAQVCWVHRGIFGRIRISADKGQG